MSSWFKVLRKNEKAIIRLLCFHNAGGGVSIFNDWWKKLPNQIEIIGVQLPGRENRFSEKPLKSIESIVLKIAKKISIFEEKPLTIFGHSMGGLISYELARYLENNKMQTPEYLYISGRPSPDFPRRKPLIHDLPQEKFIEEIIKYDGIPSEILSDKKLQSFFLPTLIADIKICEEYEFNEINSVINTPITLYNGESDLGVGLAELEGWKNVTNKKCVMKMFPGGHFYFRNNSEKFFSQFSIDLSKLISKVRLEESSKAFIGKPTIN